MSLPVEYEAARSGVALSRRHWRRLVSVVGEGRTSFLQGMLSNDVQALAEGDGCRALLLDIKGKVKGDLDLWMESDAILMACDAAVADAVVGSLRKYVLAAPVQLIERGEDIEAIGLVGPGAAPLLESIGAGRPADSARAHVTTSIAGAEVRIARTPSLAAEGFEIHASKDVVVSVTSELQRGAGGDLPMLSDDAVELLRVEAGWPRAGLELTGEQLPQEARLDDAISYDKGCYLGQETVARIHYRGNVNRLLVGLRAGAPLTAGAALFAQGREVGSVTTAVVSPRFGAIGLGYVRRELADPGSELTLGGESHESPEVRVSDLPLQGEGE